jgi:hypothetical protein
MPGRRASPSSCRPLRPSAICEDPFDPNQALWAAAGLLSSLKQRFGNLGLAAAAYNAGPGRVSAWLRKRKRLPAETRNYVEGDHRPPGEQLGQGEEAGPRHRRQVRGRDNLRVDRGRNGGLSRLKQRKTPTVLSWAAGV